MAADLVERLRAVPPFDRWAVLRAEVLAEFRTTLLMSADDELPVDANYFELGLTSLGVTEIKQRLERRLGRAVEAVSLFSHPTVADLLDNLVVDLPELFADPDGPAGAGAPPDRPAAAVQTDFRSATDQQALLRELLLEKYEPIAIVGIGLRMPGDNDTPAGFAEFLRRGGSGTVPIPADRWDVDAYSSAEGGPGKVRTRAGGFVSGYDQFDPRFFNISPKEAQYMDPQQRLVLETGWEALEHAGIDPTGLRGGDGGVYVGVSCVDYTLEVEALRYEELDGYVGTGTAHSVVPGRLSYFLGWRGPSLAVDTACSASLVALHLAVTGLRRRECGIALVGGVNSIHHPRNHIVFTQAGMLSPDGLCKTFDDGADGYSRSEACGMVVLKRLSDARRDGDRVLALVRGSAVRQDGESGGLTVPNGSAQEMVIRSALAAAMVEPADIGYIEAHGTGTSLGDPIEMGAIRAVFADGLRADPLVVGSLKTNIGHAEAAAGIAGVIKTALQLHHDEIYPHLHLDRPSRHIPWQDAPVTVPDGLRQWPAGARRGVVNSFGFAGTIASAVLEQAPPVAATEPELAAGPPQVFAISARSDRALRNQLERYRDHLAAHPEQLLADICHTATTGRAHFPVRLAAVVHDRPDLAGRIDQWLSAAGGADGGRDQPRPGNVAFLFTGQGSQYVGMGTALAARFPLFAGLLHECDELFAPYLDRSILEVIAGHGKDPAELHETRYTQPALFALEYAAAGLWRSWGVQPDILIGHSVGEIVAATVAGLFSLPDAVRLVAVRARLMQAVTAPGGMVSVSRPAEEVADLLTSHPDLGFAAFNAPDQCVVSGGRESLTKLTAALAERGISVRALPVSHAFHSPLMAEVAEEFRDAIADIRFGPLSLPLISNLTGEVADHAALTTADYWVRHIAEPVRFAAGIRAIEQRGTHTFVEVGPAPTLIGLGRRGVRRAADHVWLPSMRAADDTGETLLGAVAAGYAAGLPVAWAQVRRGAPGQRTDLPTYGFDRRRYWLPITGERHLRAASPTEPARAHPPLLGPEVSTPDQRAAGIREFATRIGPDQPAYLADHVILGQPVFPAAGYVEMLLAAQDAVYGETSRPLLDVDIREPLLLDHERPVELRLRLRGEPTGGATVEIVSTEPSAADHGLRRCHATATIAAAGPPSDELVEAGSRMAEVHAAAGYPAADRPGADLYAEYAELGLEYGPSFQRIESIGRLDEATAVSAIQGWDTGALDHLPPAVLDNVIQSLGPLIDDGQTYLPVRFRSLRLLRKPKGERLRGLVRRTGVEQARDGEFTADLAMFDGDQPVFVVRGLAFRRVTRTRDDARGLFHQARWLKRSLPRRPTEVDRRILLVGAAGPDEGVAPAVGAAPGDGRTVPAGVTVTVAPDADRAVAILAEQPTDVCWFWQAEDGPLDLDRLRRETEHNLSGLLHLLAGLDRAGFGRDQRLWLVTSGAQQLPDDPVTDRQLPAATVWGFGLSLWTEHPAYRVTLLDLPPDAPAGPALLDELLAGSDEYQVAYRAGGRHVRRILPVPADMPGDGNTELAARESEGLAGLRMVPTDDPAPVGDEIQVRMHAAGLNFKDVLNALGLLRQHADTTGTPYQPLPLGFEGAGTVVAAGPQARFAVGDAVMISHLGCLRRRVTVSSELAVGKPDNLDYAEAAGIPTAYVTAHYALHELAGMKAGDRVLIHAAAGGVGQAAMQLARLAGAQVYATASPHKHDLLHGQGAVAVFNSRTLDFADEVLAATGGAGVDIVLNSLNKEYIPEGIRVLAAGGRFVELGKLGAWTAEQVRAVRPDVAYHHFDLSEFAPERLRQINHGILTDLADQLARGELRPLPTTRYELDEVEEAFSLLSRGGNVGKLVLVLPGPRPPAPAHGPVRPDRTYLITGGFGALGLLTARKLIALGARHLALVGRREVPDAELAELAERLGGRARLTAHRCDLADPADVTRLAAALRAARHPVGGILHAAGVLVDRPVARMTWSDVATVFGPKVYGSWLLHHTFEAEPELDFFIGYSSVASVLGSAAQANYAAGNAFIDALMDLRGRQGRPGTSINWGPWGEVGMAAGLDARLARGIEAQGMRFLRPAQGTGALARLLTAPTTPVMVGEFDFDRLAGSRPLPNPLYERVARGATEADTGFQVDQVVGLPRSERIAALSLLVRSRLATALHFDDADDIGPDTRFAELGLDSLAAVELKNVLESLLGVALPTGMVFDHPSVDQLVAYLDGLLAGGPQAGDGSAVDPQRPDDGVAALSDDDVAAQLAVLQEG
ncbi:SDR family NAD(P)-dependent oxidoreductase [Micromonospora sp. LOL_014]|uniref:SDR family NAD(P)-dependent oxidoreductase n=1 Tax=Micromonospora sp. LOL_014 TaxID=3345415 RepID=UPI003A843386